MREAVLWWPPREQYVTAKNKRGEKGKIKVKKEMGKEGEGGEREREQESKRDKRTFYLKILRLGKWR